MSLRSFQPPRKRPHTQGRGTHIYIATLPVISVGTPPYRAVENDGGAGEVWVLREGQVWMGSEPEGIAGVDSGLRLDDGAC